MDKRLALARLGVAGGLALALSLVAGCGTGGGAAATTTTPQPTTINVGESEYKLDLPASSTAGETSFVVTNNGTIAHSLEIEGAGVEAKLDANVSPGQSSTLKVDLKPGTYTIYCPVDGHRGLGMEATLTVTGG